MPDKEDSDFEKGRKAGLGGLDRNSAGAPNGSGGEWVKEEDRKARKEREAKEME